MCDVIGLVIKASMNVKLQCAVAWHACQPYDWLGLIVCLTQVEIFLSLLSAFKTIPSLQDLNSSMVVSDSANDFTFIIVVTDR